MKYTGEGFKGEKALAITSVVLTIISTVLLINLIFLQRKHVKMQLKIIQKKYNNELN